MKISCVTPSHVALAAGSLLFLFEKRKSQESLSNPSKNPVDDSGLYEILNLNPSGSQILSVTCNKTYSNLVIAYADKKVISYDLGTHTIVGETVLRKRPTALGCAHFQDLSSGHLREVMVVSDKAGDILGIDLPLLKRSVLLGGHTSSVITDLVVVGDSRYIATSDRDEKVRVSRFPHAETITAYCLGHTSVVTSLAAVDTEIDFDGGVSKDKSSAIDIPSRVVSCSWDNTLALWEVGSGALLSRVNLLPEDALKPSLKDTSAADLQASALTDDNAGDCGDDDVDNANVNTNVEGEDDELPEKQYDEKSAGNYPLQVACRNHFVAVIFRNVCEVRLYKISSSGSSHDLQLVTTYTLTSLPTHVFFPSADTLAVICAKPQYMHSFQLESSQTLVSTFVDSLSRSFKSFCESNGMLTDLHIIMLCLTFHLRLSSGKTNAIASWLYNV